MFKRILTKNMLICSTIFNKLTITNGRTLNNYLSGIKNGSITNISGIKNGSITNIDINFKKRIFTSLLIESLFLFGVVFFLQPNIAPSLFLSGLLLATSVGFNHMLRDINDDKIELKNGLLLTNLISFLTVIPISLVETIYTRYFSKVAKLESNKIKVNTYLDQIGDIRTKTKSLLDNINKEITNLKLDRDKYVESEMIDTYEATHKALIANKALAESRLESIEVVFSNAKNRATIFNNRLHFTQRLVEREEMIKSVWEKNSEQWTNFNNVIELMDYDVKLISKAKEISSKISINTDIHKILTLANAAELTKDDTKKYDEIYEKH